MTRELRKLKKQIDTGEYRIDPVQVADAILHRAKKEDLKILENICRRES
jgi:anti-sigma28 factor (negative regulator of flagellin synthesis)